jgi:predicted Zn finger-like uncharacterized protein
MTIIPVVRQFRVVKKGLLGKVTKVSFKCPHCQASLLASEDEIGVQDKCPHCSKMFKVDRRAKSAFEVAEEQIVDSSPAVDETLREQGLQAQREADRLAEEKRVQDQRQIDQAKAEVLAKQQQQQSQIAEREQQVADELLEQKMHFRNAGIRQYPALDWMVAMSGLVITLHTVLGFVSLVFLLPLEVAKPIKVTVAIVVVVEVVFVGLLLKLICEMIKLFVNMAQDTERLLRFKEAEEGKEWAK